MLNKDRFTNGREMLAAFEADPCMHHTWSFAEWLFVEHTDDRLAYCRRLDGGHIGTCALTKEIRRLEKAAARKDA